VNERRLHESGSLLSSNSNEAFAPIFKGSNDFKYHKIMTRALLLYALFDIGSEAKWFWVDCFSPRCAPSGTTCLRAKTTIFLPTHSRVINFHVISSPDTSPDHRSGLFDICVLPSPINFHASAIFSPFLLGMTLSSKLSCLHNDLASR